MQPSFDPLSTYPQPGDVLDGKYRIERLLGQGGMGAVAKATHLLRRAPVALKFMSAAVLSLPGAIERFVNEGVAASQIDSDHVVKVFDVGRLPNGAPYLVMEFLDGHDLAQVLEREGPTFEAARAVHFTLQALRALHTAHDAGIIHRDMKPSNCFVITKDGEPDFVKLVDFGISKVRATDDGKGAHLTRTNSALGTPLYMSPEQARSPRDVDRRTDLYSVGAILYEMLAGRTPYSSDTGEYTEMLFKIFTTEPEPLRNHRPDLPEELSQLVARALQRNREDRFASAADMAEALAPFADERSAQVLARFRPVKSSYRPSAMNSVIPAVDTRPPVDAVARTFASAGVSNAPPPQTGVGVTKMLAPPSRRTSSGKPAVLVAMTAAVLGSTALLAFRSHSGAPKAGREGPPAGISASADDTLHNLASSPSHHVGLTPPVVLAPESPPVLTASAATASSVAAPAASSAHPATSASRGPVHPASPAAPSAAASAPSTSLPTQLGDLKLH